MRLNIKKTRNNFIQIKPIKNEVNTTESGIILAESQDTNQHFGKAEVMVIDELSEKKDICKVGDKILYIKAQAFQPIPGKDIHLLLNESVIAIVE